MGRRGRTPGASGPWPTLLEAVGGPEKLALRAAGIYGARLGCLQPVSTEFEKSCFSWRGRITRRIGALA